MKTLHYKNIIWVSLFAAILLAGCRKDEDLVPETIPEASEVNKFIWEGLHDYYLWNDQVPGLSNSSYTNKDSLNLFLNKYTDPQKLFTNLLYKYNEIDKWSFLVDNSAIIDDWISGISETMGYDFMLGQIGDSDDLFGFVRYVYKNSPAEKAGLKRGNIFMSVNNQQLTLSNYSTLLFSTPTYTLGFATITNSTISPISKTMTMTAITMQENPIHKDTIFTFNNQKIGYLVYNSFNSDFDIELNDVIRNFKEENIDRMILDLRYNGGGSVQSCIYLASMLSGTDQTQVFAKAQYNTTYQKALVRYYGASFLNDNFTSTIEATDQTPATPINTLNLQQIYMIVSDNSASASELLINGLRAYMKVIVVGINTDGKYTGSTTIRDWDDQDKVNPNHDYAMQPIVVKYSNALGVSDFVDGLIPDIVAEEDIANLLPFGDPNETLLSVVLADIKGIPVTAQSLKSAKYKVKKVARSRDFKPYANEMYIDLKNKKLQE